MSDDNLSAQLEADLGVTIDRSAYVEPKYVPPRGSAPEEEAQGLCSGDYLQLCYGVGTGTLVMLVRGERAFTQTRLRAHNTRTHARARTHAHTHTHTHTRTVGPGYPSLQGPT